MNSEFNMILRESKNLIQEYNDNKIRPRNLSILICYSVIIYPMDNRLLHHFAVTLLRMTRRIFVFMFQIPNHENVHSKYQKYRNQNPSDIGQQQTSHRVMTQFITWGSIYNNRIIYDYYSDFRIYNTCQKLDP